MKNKNEVSPISWCQSQGQLSQELAAGSGQSLSSLPETQAGISAGTSVTVLAANSRDSHARPGKMC